MNFLAHFHLAWPDAGLVAGALEGDFHKGRLEGSLPSPLEAGIELHRRIDAYTDQHPEVCKLRSRFPLALRRCAGIVIDLAFDHYLSRHWSQYSDTRLSSFNEAVLTLLDDQKHSLSEGSVRMLSRFREHDLLNRYNDWQLITATAEHIGKRLSKRDLLAEVEPRTAPLRPVIEQTFLRFYPDLMRFSAHYRQAAGPVCTQA